MIGPVDISPVQLRLACDILHKYLPGGTRVWAFGSRARWEATDASDLDLAVEYRAPVEHKIMLALNAAFDDSNLPYNVDVVDLKAVGSKFRKIIDCQKVLLATANSRFTNRQWSEVRLGDFAPFLHGKPLLTAERNPSGGIPVVGPGGIVGYHDVGLTAGPAIVIGRKGAAGAVHYFPGPCWPMDTTFYVTGTDSVLLRFKYYALQTLGLEQMNFDGAASGLNRTAAHARLLLVPDKQRQRGIARILGALDARICLNHRMNHVLDGMVRAVFKSWFVDFDPVRAKMGGHWRSGESLPGLPLNLYDLFPDNLTDSELGYIPKGWEVKLLGDVAKAKVGEEVEGGRATPGTNIPEYRNKGIHCRAAPGDPSGQALPAPLDAGLKISNAGLRQTGSELLPPGTVLMYFGDTIGHPTFTEMPASPNRGFIAMLPRMRIARHFLYGWCGEFRNKMAGCANGSAFLDVGDFLKTPIVTPNTRIMSAYDKLASTLHGRIVANERSSRNLAAQRDALLPKLMSGELNPAPNGGKKRPKSERTP